MCSRVDILAEESIGHPRIFSIIMTIAPGSKGRHFIP